MYLSLFEIYLLHLCCHCIVTDIQSHRLVNVNIVMAFIVWSVGCIVGVDVSTSASWLVCCHCDHLLSSER